MAWKNIPEKKVLATLKEKSALKGTVSEKFDIYVDGAVPGGDGDVQGISMTIDPNTYVMTTQLKDGKGGNVGSPATIDLPLESMVVGGEYDEENKSIILTLKNGQTVEFSVADLVSGLQTEITSENPLSADLIEETTNKNFVTEQEKEDISSISGLADDVETLNGYVEGLQSDVDGLNGDVENLAGDVSTLQGDVSALQSDLGTKQDVIDSSNKLSADLIAETNNNKVMTSAERTKLAGIAAGAEVNVQADWNQTNSSADDYIKNKPTIPSKVSDLTNDAGYQNASQVSSAIASAVGEITSFEFEIVQTLPASGEAGVVYLVPNSGTTPNIYDEYIWVNNAFEKIGTTDIDLSDYVTNSDLHDYTASVAFTPENGIEITDDDDNSIGFAIEMDAETGSQSLAVTGSDGSSFNVPNADDVTDALAGKADAIAPSDLPSGSTQNGVITTSDHTDIDPSVVSEGQIVVDSTDGKVYIVSEITTDPETGDPVNIVWKEIQTDKEIVYANMTVTDVQAMTFVVNDYTANEIHNMLNAGMTVFYRLTLPQAVGGLAAGVYDFRPVYHTNGAVMSSLSGSASNNALLGIAYHMDVGTPYIEMRLLQNQIDSNNKLSADLIDSSSSDGKTYQTGTGAPTTSTAGSVGEMYVDKSTGAVYACTGVNGGVYTWTEIIAKDRVKTLTTADYNYPTSGTKTSIALWSLPSGIYNIGEALTYKTNINNTTSTTAKDEYHFIIIYRRGVATIIDEFSALGIMRYSTNASTGAKQEFAQLAFVDGLNTTDTSRGLTANQGKVLNEKIEGRVKVGSWAPSTTTVGTVGLLYEDTTNGKLYQCTAIVPGTDPDPDTYTWKEVGGTAVATISSQDWNSLWQ